MTKIALLIFAACLMFTKTTVAESPHLSPQELTPTEYNKNYFRSGDSYIAGQPTETAIRQLSSQGVTAVVNLRTPAEMADKKQVPFDEAKLVESLGLDYVHIPMNGKKPYSEQALAEFIKAYDAHDGNILLHCRSAKRASQLWAAFLVKHEGMEITKARKVAESINLDGAPLNGLLGASGSSTKNNSKNM